MSRNCNKTLEVCLLASIMSGALFAQDNAAPVPSCERWNVFWQATSIGQYHGSFPAAYSGTNSLASHPEAEVSLTSTLFFSLRLPGDTQLVFDPEIAGGRGFSGVTGVANATNGELPRVATATPKPYLARLYLTHDFALGSATEPVEADENQLAGTRPLVRYTITAGRFTLTDFFDQNRYSHDPRTQFLGWGVMYNGAWDYAADTRGYTWGWVHELHLRDWSFRYASALEPKLANGLRFDRRVFKDRGDVFEGERRWAAASHPGALRLLSSLAHTDSGDYGAALQLAATTHPSPNIDKVLRSGTLKYGFGVNGEQELRGNVGVFGRLGWNDGHTEDFAFTAIDRIATAGVSLPGALWNRRDDGFASEVTIAGLSAVHALYLARGGVDFIIGDERLNYGTERIWESYYTTKVPVDLSGAHLFVSVDAQYIVNPAYNRDRGPLWAWSLRLHLEAGGK